VSNSSHGHVVLLNKAYSTMALPVQHKQFVQSLMSQGAVKALDAAALYNACGALAVEHCGVARARTVAADGTGLSVAADAINDKLERFRLQLRSVHSEWEKASYWGVVNTAADDAARLATDYSRQELMFFFSLVNDLIDGHKLTLLEIQNSGPEFKLRTAEAGKTVRRLEKEKWLKVIKEKRRGGHTVVFGVRSLLELPNVRAWHLELANSIVFNKNAENSDDDDDDVDEDGAADEHMGEVDDDDDLDEERATRAPLPERRAGLNRLVSTRKRSKFSGDSEAEDSDEGKE
jgi:Nse1 non-SMC component of SMC5-6 complex